MVPNELHSSRHVAPAACGTTGRTKPFPSWIPPYIDWEHGLAWKNGDRLRIQRPISDPYRARERLIVNVKIGSAPDSWGVWFAEDPKQIPWQRFLDEVAEAGYEWIELGPYGYLPTDLNTLRAPSLTSAA